MQRAHADSYVLETRRSAIGAVLPLLDHERFLPACFVSFMTVRGLMLLIPYAPVGDPLWYLTQAARLAQGHGYALDSGPTAYFPVGWSAFLAVFFKVFDATLAIAQLVDLTLAAATFFLVLAIARQTLRDEFVARLSVLLLAVYPNNIAYVAIPSTETFFTFLLLLTWLLWIRSASLAAAAICGVLLGLATLTKTQAILLPALFLVSDLLVAAVSRRTACRRCLAMCAALGITLLPWLYRNHAVFGEFPVLSTNGGMNLLLGNNALAGGGYTHDESILALIDFSGANEVQADRLAARLATDWVMAHPGDFVRLVPAKLFRLWAPDGEAVWVYELGYTRFAEFRVSFQTARLINQACYVAILAGFVIAPFTWRRRVGSYFLPGTQFGYLLAGYTTLTSLVVFGEPRFHFPVMPFAIMCTASVLALRLGGIYPSRAATPSSATQS